MTLWGKTDEGVKFPVAPSKTNNNKKPPEFFEPLLKQWEVKKFRFRHLNFLEPPLEQ